MLQSSPGALQTRQSPSISRLTILRIYSTLVLLDFARSIPTHAYAKLAFKRRSMMNLNPTSASLYRPCRPLGRQLPAPPPRRLLSESDYICSITQVEIRSTHELWPPFSNNKKSADTQYARYTIHRGPLCLSWAVDTVSNANLSDAVTDVVQFRLRFPTTLRCTGGEGQKTGSIIASLTPIH
jgi:hypothetical protein